MVIVSLREILTFWYETKPTTSYSLICLKIPRRLDTVNTMAAFRSGFCPRRTLTIYKSLIHLKLGFSLSTTCNLPNYVFKTIQTFQNNLPRRCAGHTPSTPIRILRIIFGEFFVTERALLLTAKEFLKVKIIRPSFFQMIITRAEKNQLHKLLFKVSSVYWTSGHQRGHWSCRRWVISKNLWCSLTLRRARAL